MVEFACGKKRKKEKEMMPRSLFIFCFTAFLASTSVSSRRRYACAWRLFLTSIQHL